MRVNTGQAGKARHILSDKIKCKLNEIEQCIENPVQMLGVTGYADYKELCIVLFHTLALLEVQGQAAMEVDQSMTKKIDCSQQQRQPKQNGAQYCTIQPEDMQENLPV